MLKEIDIHRQPSNVAKAARTEVLVRRAARGDERAWEALVERFGGLVASVTRAHRLSPADAADVGQTTWLRLAQHLERIRQPERIGAWLAATARRECLRILRGANRIVLEAEVETPGANPPPESELMASDEREALRRALDRLPDRPRSLLRALLMDPPPTYEEVSTALGMPIGSIGPTRSRALAELRQHLELEGVYAV